METSFQLDPEISPAEAEAQSLAANEAHVSTGFRRHVRIWTKTEWDAHLVRLAKAAVLPDVEEYGLTEGARRPAGNPPVFYGTRS